METRRPSVRSRRRARSFTGALVVVVGLLSSLAACSSGSSTPAAPADLVLPLVVGLRRDDAGLAEAALQRSTPKGPDYRQWLTPAEIAAQYGAPAGRAEAALATLTAAGFTGSVDATGGLLVGQMRAADAAKFFGNRIVQLPIGESGLLAMPEKALEVPKKLAGDAVEVIGLTMLIDADTTSTVLAAGPTPPADPACPTSKGLGGALAAHYGFASLLQAGATGKGVRITMVEVSPTSQKALELTRACRPFRVAPVTVTAADASTPEAFIPKAVESTLDITAVSLMAPGIDGIDIFQANGFAPLAYSLAVALAGTGPAETPRIVSLSLGFCESQLTDADIAVGERVLMGAAAMGTTVVASTGDFGSSACYPDDLAEAVQYPASSHWVLGVGGTTLQRGTDGTITGEIAWGRGGFGAGGGRTSRISRPSWQNAVPVEGKRIVPDVAFLADPSIMGAIAICDVADRCTWEVNGGTSATAPGVAAGIALIMHRLAGPDGVPVRLGQLNQALYGNAATDAAALAATGSIGRAPMIRDIVTGSNDVHGIGCCSAVGGYDAATGWGVIDFGVAAERYTPFIRR